jgi:hypothetical protein
MRVKEKDDWMMRHAAPVLIVIARELRRLLDSRR